MLKKIGVVLAAAIGLSMAATPAMAAASPQDDRSLPPLGIGLWDGDFQFEDGYLDFVNAGGYFGYGAAGLIASAWSVFWTTPAEIAEDYEPDAEIPAMPAIPEIPEAPELPTYGG